MYYYSLYGCTIESIIEFPQLRTSQKPEIQDIVIKEGGVSKEILEKPEDCCYEIGLKQSWFQNPTGFFSIEHGKVIRYQLKEGANISYARTYILGYGIAMLLLQRQIMSIHCSAVAGEEGAILIAGESGAGKSTLTTEYLKEGYRLLADDITAIRVSQGDSVLAYPAFPYQKLCRDAALREKMDLDQLIYIDEDKDKFLVPRKNQFSEQPIPIKAMVILSLSNGDKIECKEVQGIHKLLAIRKNLFLERLYGEWMSEPTVIQACLEIGSKVPIYLLRRPKSQDTTKELKELINQIITER